MIILPSVSFSSNKHPAVQFCLKLTLGSTPTIDDAEMTAEIIGKLFWLALGVCTLLVTFDFVWISIVFGGVDLLGRKFGIRTRFLFIPIWVISLAVYLIFMGFFDHLCQT